jgi:putative membrane protein
METKQVSKQTAGAKSPRGSWLFSTLKGALIGTGAILPGISGGVLCVVFGVYRPVMELLAHPIRELKKNFWYFVPLFLGLSVGVLGISKLLQWVLERAETPAMWTFIGLIAGTFPSLWKEAGKEARTKGSWVALLVTFALMLPFLFYMESMQNGQATQAAQSAPETYGVWIWLACGVFWGLGFIAPGLSPSSIFFVLGVMGPMMQGISTLSLPVLLPMGFGLIVCVLSLSRGIGWLLTHKNSVTMHVVLGLTFASTVAILPFGNARTWVDVAVYELCFGVGFAVALWMDRMNGKMEAGGLK